MDARAVGAELLHVDPAAAPSLIEQIRSQIIEAVRSGALVPGDRLPTVRGLAETLGLSAQTVAKAYRALEQDAVIETRGRSGSFVSAAGDGTVAQAQRAAADFAARMRELRVSPEDAVAHARAALGIRD